MQAVSPKELVLIEPNDKEERERNRKSAKTAHRVHQLTEGPRDFKRHNQQRNRESEHGIAQPFGTRDLMAAPTKLLVVSDAFIDELFAKHANERNSLHRTIQGLLNDAIQFSSFLPVVTDEPHNQFSVTIKNKRLGNILIVLQIVVHQLVIGKAERILNLKLLRK